MAKPSRVNPDPQPLATSVRLTQAQIDFLREEAAKRGHFSFKYPEKGAVSWMIVSLVEQFYVFCKGQPKKKKKLTVK